MTAASAAMTWAMVQYSRAKMAGTDPGGWLSAYAMGWAAILSILVVFIGEEPGALRRNLPLLVIFPLGWFALHALVLHFGMALRDAPAVPVPPGSDDVAPPPPPTLIQRIVGAVKTIVWIFFALVIIGIGEAIPALKNLDRNLAPHRERITAVLITLLFAGFALFMGGILRLVLRGKGNKVIITGVLLSILTACAFGIALGPPGLKLLVMLTVAYAVLRIFISMWHRTRRRPSGRRSR